jgi:DNA invertase Pin-like site-specific DNA recombinase
MKYFLYCRKSTEAEDRQVMSLDSQRGELERAFGGRSDIEIVEVVTEAKSAKEPGRPLFNQMIGRIEAGEAEGIVAWAPDRLARNSIDGGRLIYLLDRGALRDLKFATYTFENNSQGKFMLNIMLGQSKYYSDNLSEVVKRGNRTKLERGWRPGPAPTGYRNDPATKTIELDPERYKLVRKLFEAVVAGASARQACRQARKEWGLTTPSIRKGGGLISVSAAHHILTNPFYAGVIEWNGKTYEGRHTPLVSVAEFEAVQAVLRTPGREKPKALQHPYLGLFRCGACGRSITAERKTNRHGHKYLYYHCTGRNKLDACKEPSVEVRSLEQQLVAFLEGIRIDVSVGRVLAGALDELEAQQCALVAEARRKADVALAELRQQKAGLPLLRVRGAIDDDELASARSQLDREIAALQSRRDRLETVNGIEPARALISFSVCAVSAFKKGVHSLNRDIIKIAGSNPTLSGGKLSIQAANPFRLIAEMGGCPSRLGHSDNISQPLAQRRVKELVAAVAADRLQRPDRYERLVCAVERISEQHFD